MWIRTEDKRLINSLFISVIQDEATGTEKESAEHYVTCYDGASNSLRLNKPRYGTEGFALAAHIVSHIYLAIQQNAEAFDIQAGIDKFDKLIATTEEEDN